ncbi:MAG: spondin domain-containing protein [Flavobacteriaceae bacterium]
MKKIFLTILSLVFIWACSEESESAELKSGLELPIVNFTSDDLFVSVGETVSFTSAALNTEELLWSFPGGSPETSTESNPSVTYDTPGSFSVSLTGSNRGGSDTETKSDYIYVLPAQIETATYTVTFRGNWSPAKHPLDFPTGLDHFSSAVGMVHKSGAQIFETGSLASEGIEDMAENGSNGALAGEVQSLITTSMALDYFSGGGLGSGTAERSFEIEVSSDYPLVTIVSMIAPSPDWFVAVRDVELYTRGEFVETLTLQAKSYDSGTDNGTSFTSPNSDTNPAENISRITSAPLGDGTTVNPALASFSFERKE